MGLSQREVGLLAGLDARLANIRINQYERQAHHPNYSFVRKLAHALRRPEAYFYAADDELAEFIVFFSRLDAKERSALLKRVRSST